MNLKKLVSISFFMQGFYIKKLVSVICVVVVLVFFSNKTWAVEENDLGTVSRGINKFSFDLYKKLKDENKNGLAPVKPDTALTYFASSCIPLVISS